MSTSPEIASATIRAADVLTASFVAGTVYTFSRKVESFSIAVTYTRSTGVAGFAEMLVEVSPDSLTWYRLTQAGTLSVLAPIATVPVYLGLYSLPAPASDAAILFSVPFSPDGGMQHVRVSFREASGLAAGTLAASLHATLATV